MNRPEYARNPVRCTGCLALIGYGPATGRIWCRDPSCPCFAPARTNEARDDLIFLLHKLGRSPTDLGPVFGIARARIQQVINERSRS